jgi:proline dehydrogenase
MLRHTLLALSKNRRAQALLARTPPLRRAVRRFVAGEALDEALPVVLDLNLRGLETTLDILGEATTSEADARRAADAYGTALSAIGKHRARAHVSVKLSQLGLDVSPELARELLGRIADDADRVGTFVRVDMEDSLRLPAILGVFDDVWESGRRNVGIVLQAYLRRTQSDAERYAALGVNIRLCKGAYAESATVAFARKADVDEQFARVAEYLLDHGRYVALATHDERLVRRALAYAVRAGIPPDRFEFQLLHGIRRDLQKTLTAEGYRVRVYVPYGAHWYPYYMRRLAERPANVAFILRHLARA